MGGVNFYRIRNDDSLIEIARKYDLGFNEIADANPAVDPFAPPPGATIRIPTMWIVPAVAQEEGIVVNLAEMRLYLFRPGRPGTIMTFPVSIGDAGRETPVGSFAVTEKLIDPVWRVPESIRLERPELAGMVPAGPGNPLGSHALRLNTPGILIHGTNRPWGLGRKVTHGCIRLYEEDIGQLYHAVTVETRVTVVDQPVKIGRRGGRIYMEVHRQGNRDHLMTALELVVQKELLEEIDPKKLSRAVKEQSGIPVDITH